ncbi:hypothetical protein ACFXKR_23750 [Streptomyces violascens]|uniref:hypothetical protein n=1 Tax=Streptomyces violascens TaxID=67381 RepID=UPI0036921538
MSFGDPNNPYGQQPQQPPQGGNPYGQPQGQPGYGYPQGQQGVPQQGYGYPQQPGQAPGQPPYGAYPQAPGMPGMPMEMPGLMKTARVLLFILAGLQIIIGLIAGIAVGTLQDVSNGVGSGDKTSGLAGVGILVAILVVALGALSIFLGVKFAKGGNGIRITTIVYASLMLLGGVVNLFGGQGGSATFGGLVSLAMAGIILASMVTSQASAWFSRPRY